MEGLKAQLDELERKAKRRKNKHRTKKRILKGRTKLIRFNRPEDRCFVVSIGHAKCSRCQTIYGMHVIGCNDCFKAGYVNAQIQYGAMVNNGVITRDRFKPVISEGDFIGYQQLYDRFRGGDRFIDLMGRVIRYSDFIE